MLHGNWYAQSIFCDIRAIIFCDMSQKIHQMSQKTMLKRKKSCVEWFIRLPAHINMVQDMYSAYYWYWDLDCLIFCDMSQKIHQNVTKNSSGTQNYDVIFVVLDIQPAQTMYIIVTAPTTSILGLPLYSWIFCDMSQKTLDREQFEMKHNSSMVQWCLHIINNNYWTPYMAIGHR